MAAEHLYAHFFSPCAHHNGMSDIRVIIIDKTDTESPGRHFGNIRGFE